MFSYLHELLTNIDQKNLQLGKNKLPNDFLFPTFVLVEFFKKNKLLNN